MNRVGWEQGDCYSPKKDIVHLRSLGFLFIVQDRIRAHEEEQVLKLILKYYIYDTFSFQYECNTHEIYDYFMSKS